MGPGGVSTVRLSPDSRLLASSWSWAGVDITRVWDVKTGTAVYEVEGREAAFSPDGQLLATTLGWAGLVRLWDASSGQPVRDLAPPDVTDWIVALRFSPDGRSLLGGFGGFGIGLWDVESGELRWEEGTHAEGIVAVAFSPDGTTLAVGGLYHETVVRMWDLRTRKETLALKGHSNSIRDATFSPDGRKLATASADGTIRLRDAGSGRLLLTLVVLPETGEGVSEEWIACTPEGYYVSSQGANRFLRWQDGTDLREADAYAATYHQPAVVAQALR
jgi:WD40 repeat protein